MSARYYVLMFQLWHNVKYLSDFSFGTQAHVRVVVLEEKDNK